MRPILTLILGCILFSCTNKNSTCSGKQVTCPGFSNAIYDQWFPYIKGQQSIFATPAGDKDTIRILESIACGTYQTSVSGTSPSCFSDAHVSSDLTMGIYKFDVHYSQSSDQYTPNTSQFTSILVKGSMFQRAGISDTGTVALSYTITPAIYSRYNASTIINNRTFNNVQEIYKDTTKLATVGAQPYKIWIAKNIGLVAYEEYHGQLWIKQ